MKNFIKMIKKVDNYLSDKWLKIGIFLGVSFLPALGFAGFSDPTIGGQDAGSIAQHLDTEVSSWQTFFWDLSKASGIGIAIYGLFSAYNAKKNHEQKKSMFPGIACIILGSTLFFLKNAISAGGSTVFGS